MNFFVKECQEPIRNNEVFGLCDDQDGGKAYTNDYNPSTWVATVKNQLRKDVLFIAIDKCVIKDNEYPDRGRCDCMLQTDSHLYFVELKNQQKGWVTNAVNQLESTIQFFIDNHDINLFRHKKAFVCNKQHKNFHEIDNETNLRFFRRYRVRLDVQAEVLIF